MKITSDLHIHTALSSCAKPEATVAYYMDKARELGLKTLGFTDHLWDSAIPNANKFYAPQDFAHISLIKEELEKADKTGIDRVLFGAEGEYDPWRHGVGLTPAVAEQLEVLLVPNSHTHMMMPKDYYDPPRRHAEFMLEAFYDIINSEIAPYITAIPHPFAAVACSKYYPATVPVSTITDDEFKACFAASAEKGIALEINPCFFNKKTPEELDRHELIRMFRIAKAEGSLFTVGIDSHSQSGHYAFDAIYPTIEVLGLTEADLHPLAR
jgi:histidinol phosphatase-like PHP family hydrolase